LILLTHRMEENRLPARRFAKGDSGHHRKGRNDVRWTILGHPMGQWSRALGIDEEGSSK